MHNLHVAYIQRMCNLCITYKNVKIVGPLRRMTTYTTVLKRVRNVLKTYL